MPANKCLHPSGICLVNGFLLVGLLFLHACSGAPQPYGSEQSVLPSPAPELSSSSLTAIDKTATLPSGLKPYASSIRFTNLSLNDGLSQSVVLDIQQDLQGFLWLATQEGLNRYDGYKFVVFKNDPDDPNSPTGNYFNAIDIDRNGKLWLATDAGLNCYDPSTGQWTYHLHDPDNPETMTDDHVFSVLVASDGMIWAGTTNNGLNRLDPATGKVTRFRNQPDDPASLGLGSVFTIYEDTDGVLWVGTTNGGLNRLDKTTGKFTHFVYREGDPASLSHNVVQAIYQDHLGQMWVGTLDGGLNRFDPKTGHFTRYLTDPTDLTTLSHNSVFSIFEDSWGRLWVGTFSGLNLFDRDSRQFTRFLNDPENPSSLPNNQIYSIFQDRTGILWFGTFGSGVAIYDPLKDKFLHVQMDPANPDGLSSNYIFSIYEDSQERLWLGTYGGGLNRMDLISGAWTIFTAQNSGLSDDSVFSMAQDEDGYLWLGGGLGLNRFDPRTGENRIVVRDQIILNILIDHQGVLWFGTTTNGLGKLDRGSGRIQYYQLIPGDPTSLSDNNVMALQEVNGVLWVGTFAGGLNRMDPVTGAFRRYQHDPEVEGSLSNNIILCIYPSQDNKFLWLATGGGLNKFEIATGKSQAYREKDGLPNDMVYAILEDGESNLWLSTNRGLSRFNPETGMFRNYDQSDGLQANEFNQGAYWKNEDGLMFFGGINGFNIFDPELVRDDPYAPPVIVTGLKLYNKPVAVGPDSPLNRPIEYSREIELAYTDEFFELDFSNLHFSSPQQNQYAFMFEGLDEDWIYIGNRNTITFSRLPPGDYALRIKASNSDGVWNETGAGLRILIPPPFWQTLWFRLLAAGSLLSVIAAAVYLRIQTVEKQRRKLEVLVEERTHQLRETMLELEHSKEAAEAANRAKSVFLANMSHEFRTPLNAILGFTQIMDRDEELNSDQQENIEVIHRSSEHLLGLINDVLDMSKIEAGRIALQPTGFDLQRVLLGLAEMFQLRAESKNVSLRLEISPGVPQYAIGDEGKIRQVLMNLLGNAVKFTDQGQICLRVFPAGAGEAKPGDALLVTFEVEDTGSGMTPEEIDIIFTPFTQASAGTRSQEGTGLGLAISQQYVNMMGSQIFVKSEPGAGSTFSFTIPITVATAEDLEIPRLMHRVIGLQPGQPEYRILVVDDQETNRLLLKKFLTPIGFTVREAANGEEAVKIWEEWQPQLIFMDMRMPVMDGYEATRRIKATTGGQATVIIALTASGLEEEKSVILSEGCDDYLRKPFHEEDFFVAIGKHLGVRYTYRPVDQMEAVSSEVRGLEGSLRPSAMTDAETENVVQHLAAREGVWLDALERAVILGDIQAIAHSTHQISAEDPELASWIDVLALRFDHDRILNLVRLARQRRGEAA